MSEAVGIHSETFDKVLAFGIPRRQPRFRYGGQAIINLLRPRSPQALDFVESLGWGLVGEDLLAIARIRPSPRLQGFRQGKSAYAL